MNSVIASNYIYRSRTRQQETTLDHPLARRMTALQLSVMELMEETRTNLGNVFSEMMSDSRIPIYYSTSIGEINSVTTVARAVHAKTLPCSPAAFQHSVHNAAAGYIASTYKTRNPSLTFSSGFLSFDLALTLTARKIAAGLIDGAFLVHGEEKRTTNPDIESEAEVLLLLGETSRYRTAGNSAGNSWLLKTIQHMPTVDSLSRFRSDCPKEVGTEISETSEESSLSAMFPLRLSEKTNCFTRIANALNGESVVSIWSRL